MSDVKCPYCGHEQETNHDDGYGYDESDTYEQTCYECEKEFKFTTQISFDYQVYCQDDDHDMQHCGVESLPDFYECSKCAYYKIINQQHAQGRA
jgi:DNA-directed RNA polymerase subunit RPC12/RpoP